MFDASPGSEGSWTSDVEPASLASRVTGSAGSRLDEGHPRRHFTDEEECAAMTIVRSTNRVSLTDESESARARAHTAGLVVRERERKRWDDDVDDGKSDWSPRV